jgi:hypothetical protein
MLYLFYAAVGRSEPPSAEEVLEVSIVLLQFASA